MPSITKDTLLAVLSDMHTGSSTALFPNHFWQGEHQNHTPDKRQQRIFEHFDFCTKETARMRKNKRLIVVHDGDAIEGWHHNSHEICVMNTEEQKELHIELMDGFLRKTKYNKKGGDQLYYVRGTEVHTEDKENKIAQDLGAEKQGRLFVGDFLELLINGRRIWFLHHGKNRGKGANEGNALRNWLRDVYFDCQKRGVHPPDIVITGHTHTPTYNTFIMRRIDGYHTIHGVICPSWQEKTRYAWKVAPIDTNEIGSVLITIKADGTITEPQILIKETGRTEAVYV